ncbi:hypothetical protein [Halomonas dongshanensis]|uniref:DUF1828 domain-containing protein n=1 Tax=Halomonas dongshanensis TaxID=2890835 RepID=A0ABT2EBL2_9GAMM|nr:hypothetical protein [Halomonas dongshanensis]MCS2608480.1 hypothetical protein [Halomonas dongshanensis]
MSGNVFIDERVVLLDKWGISCREVVFENYKDKILGCFVSVSDLNLVAEKLAESVIDFSWISNLDKGTKRAYERTSKETAAALVEIFKSTGINNGIINEEFGEVLVSIGASQTLASLFEHISLPIAELWKPQLKQNEGFDFHTVCKLNFINYGEAKYSLSSNPHGKSLSQTKRFFHEEKHFRDRVHLISLVDEVAINNLDNDQYGAIIAFSINSENASKIFENAIDLIEEKIEVDSLEKIYMVGVGVEYE